MQQTKKLTQLYTENKMKKLFLCFFMLTATATITAATVTPVYAGGGAGG